MTLAVVAAGGLAPIPARADTVYMRNGKRLVGKVTREGGKLKVEMALGTVIVDAADVIYVGKGDAPAESPAPVIVDDDRPAAKAVSPLARWVPGDATLPEALVFMTARRIELLPPGSVTEGTRRQLSEWQMAVQDRKRKCGALWLDRADQQRRRAAFDQKLRAAADKVRQASRIYARTRSDERRKRRLEADAAGELMAAAKVWPDKLISDFLAATLQLRAKHYDAAHAGFARCIGAEPLVAAFHQGRGLALLGLKRPIRAVEEFAICLELRDDTYQTVEMLKAAMQEVPGESMRHPSYERARLLLARYEEPRSAYRSYNRSVAWLMPGKQWTSRDNALVSPPYDRLVARQALGVAVSQNVLAADRDALAGALAVYVQVTAEKVVRAEPARRQTYRRGRGEADIPLATLSVPGATFEPMDLAKPAALKPGQTLTVRAVNVYRQMGTDIRMGEAKVVSADDSGVKLDQALLPGEAVGVGLAGDAFAALLTSRADARAADCGRSRAVKPADLSGWVEQIKRSSSSGSRYRASRSPTLKADAARVKAAGRVFLVHILAGEKAPTKLAK